MNYIDIAIIAIVALFALIGLWKGFGKTFIKLFCFAAAIVVTYLLASKVINWVLGVGFIQRFIVGDSVSLAALYTKSFPEALLNATEGTVLEGMLGMYVNPMIERYTALGGPAVYGMTYAKFIAVNMSIHFLSVLMWIIIYVVIRVVASIISWLLTKIFIHGEPKVFSRILGFVFGAARGGVVVVCLLVILSAISPFKFATSIRTNVDKSVIGTFAAKYTYKATDKILYGDGTDGLDGLLAKAGFTRGDYGSGEQDALETAKTNAKTELDTYRAGKDDALYSADNVTALNAAVTAGKTAIDGATTEDDVAEALTAAKTALDEIPTESTGE